MMTTPRPDYLNDDWPGWWDLVKGWPCEVLVFETLGSYQGDHIVLLRRLTTEFDGVTIAPTLQYGFVDIGYGSCSGCDALEAVLGWGMDKSWDEVVQLSNDVFNDVVWGSAEEMRRRLQDDAWMQTQYWRHEGGASGAVDAMLEALEGASG